MFSKKIVGAVLTCVAISIYPAVAQQLPASKGSKNLQKASPPSPLKAFENIEKRYIKFFSTPRRLVYGSKYSKSPSGGVFYVIEYSAKDMSYDVETTTSLVSPYIAYIKMSLLQTKNEGCGTVQGYKDIIGWPTADEAISDANNNAACFKSSKDDVWYDVRFEYGYQDNQWVFTGVVVPKYAIPEYAISAAVDKVSGPAIPIDSPPAVSFNKAWRAILN